jgi:N6-adenosine-specific RNA methylase IME4
MPRIWNTLVIDPPWEYPEGFPSFGDGPEDRTPLPYPTMTVDAIATLPVYDVMQHEGYVFLWTTSRYLPDAFSVLRAWRCAYRQTLTWAKPPRGLGPGGAWAVTTEHVLVAQRIGAASNGRRKSTSGVRVDRSCFDWPRRAHSEKPGEFYTMLERTHLAPRIDVFARRLRPGWACVGSAIDGQDIRASLLGAQPAVEYVSPSTTRRSPIPSKRSLDDLMEAS